MTIEIQDMNNPLLTSRINQDDLAGSLHEVFGLAHVRPYKEKSGSDEGHRPGKN
jgi:hypothetical protein